MQENQNGLDDRDYQQKIRLGIIPVVIANPSMVSVDKSVKKNSNDYVMYVGRNFLIEILARSLIFLKLVGCGEKND